MSAPHTIPTRYVELYQHVLQLERDWDDADSKGGVDTSRISADLAYWRRKLDEIPVVSRILDVLSRYGVDTDYGTLKFRFIRATLQVTVKLSLADWQLLVAALEEYKVMEDPKVKEYVSRIQT